MKNSNLSGIIHVGLAVLAIAVLVLAFSFSFKVVDRIKGEVAAAKVLPSLGTKPKNPTVSLFFYPNTNTPMNDSQVNWANGHVWMQDVDIDPSPSKLVFTLAQPQFYVGLALQHPSIDLVDAQAKAHLYGWTTANCSNSPIQFYWTPMHFNGTKWDIYNNDDITFPTMNGMNCVADPSRPGWYSFHAEALYDGLNHTGSDAITAGLLATGFANGGTTDIKFEIAKMTLCNESPLSNCPTSPWPPVQIQGTIVSSRVYCSDTDGTLSTPTNAILWTAAAGADAYEIQYCTGSNCPNNYVNVPADPNPNDLMYFHTGLVKDQLYSYRVRGVNTLQGTAGPWGMLTVVNAPACMTFVTSQGYTGNLGGVSGADSKCQALADAINPYTGKEYLNGTFKAWISDSSRDAKNVIPNAKYQLITGAKVADNKADLTDGTLDAAINRSERGGVPFEQYVFTGTLANGTKATNNCYNWTSANQSDNVQVGNYDASSSAWTNHSSEFTCSYTPPVGGDEIFRSIYCFQTDGIVGSGL